MNPEIIPYEELSQEEREKLNLNDILWWTV